MQSTKLLLLSILSQPPVPYVQSSPPPDMTIEILAARPEFQIFLDEERTQSLQDLSLYEGQTGTMYIVIDSADTPDMVYWQVEIEGVLFPFGWDAPFGDLIEERVVVAEFKITEVAGENITFALGGTPYTMDVAVLPAPVSDVSGLVLEDGVTPIADESSTSGSEVVLGLEGL